MSSSIAETTQENPQAMSGQVPSSRALRGALWVAQVLACVAFVSTGLIKGWTPIPTLAAMWPWTGELPAAWVRGLALIDIAGGLGVLLPALTRFMPRLTVIAAACCVVLQLCAMVFHLLRGEAEALPVNAVFLGLVAFVWWGRRRWPLAAR